MTLSALVESYLPIHLHAASLFRVERVWSQFSRHARGGGGEEER